MTNLVTDSERKCSRYGRHQKIKEHDDFVPVEITRYITKSSPVKSKSTQKSDIIVTQKIDVEIDTKENSKPLETVDLTESLEDREVSTKTVQLEERAISDVDSARGSSIDLEEHETKFKSGDILWGRCASLKPFWPCIVCESPENDTIFMSRL
jgi:hypothetical protein